MAGVMKKSRMIIAMVLVLCMLAVVYGFIEPHLIQTTEVSISDADIPQAFDNTRIVFVSDIHHGAFFSISRVRELVEKINALNPDIIFLGGDYTYNGWRYLRPVFAELRNLKASIGKYGVLGNHDHWGIDAMTEIMSDAGIELLNNSSVWIDKDNERIKIGGVADLYEDIQDISPTINDVKDNDFVILLSHNPDYVEEIRTRKIDFVFSGHTHGGQMTLFGLWAPLIPSFYGQKYRTGIIETEYTKVLVSRGVGMVYIPLRFFAQPEIGLIQLKSQSD